MTQQNMVCSVGGLNQLVVLKPSLKAFLDSNNAQLQRQQTILNTVMLLLSIDEAQNPGFRYPKGINPPSPERLQNIVKSLENGLRALGVININNLKKASTYNYNHLKPEAKEKLVRIWAG